ncbi:MAG: hypothetical protein IJ745_00315 [Bacteroidales bacterium]|nr:hypothetical protein [Bacteroidales bacterium]
MKKIILLLLIAHGVVAHSQIRIMMTVDSARHLLNVTYIHDERWAGNVYFPKVLTETNCYPKSSTESLILYEKEMCGHDNENVRKTFGGEMYYAVIIPDEMLIKTKGGFLYKNYDGDDYHPEIVNSIMKYRKEEMADNGFMDHKPFVDSSKVPTMEDILTLYRGNYVFLKYGETYTESFSIEPFFKTGASFSFYISDSWRVTNEGDIVPWHFCHYESIKNSLPKNVGDYKLYEGLFSCNSVEIINNK